MKQRYTFLTLIAICCILSATFAKADFPKDAETWSGTLTNNTTVKAIEVASGSVYTIYSVRMQQSGVASDTWLRCGSKTIAYNWAKDYSLDTFQFKCKNSIFAQKTGQDSSFITFTYTPYNIASKRVDLVAEISSTSYKTLGSIASNSLSLFDVYASMTSGDVIISLLLFLLIMLYVLGMIFRFTL